MLEPYQPTLLPYRLLVLLMPSMPGGRRGHFFLTLLVVHFPQTLITHLWPVLWQLKGQTSVLSWYLAALGMTCNLGAVRRYRGYSSFRIAEVGVDGPPAGPRVRPGRNAAAVSSSSPFSPGFPPPSQTWGHLSAKVSCIPVWGESFQTALSSQKSRDSPLENMWTICFEHQTAKVNKSYNFKWFAPSLKILSFTGWSDSTVGRQAFHEIDLGSISGIPDGLPVSQEWSLSTVRCGPQRKAPTQVVFPITLNIFSMCLSSNEPLLVWYLYIFSSLNWIFRAECILHGWHIIPFQLFYGSVVNLSLL